MDGYINTNNIPDEYSKVADSNWKAYFSAQLLNSYSSGINSIGNTKFATLETIKNLNKDFYITKNLSGETQGNVRAISSMLDTNLWKEFMDRTDGTGKAQYAIGGPTIEMLLSSYNQTHSTNYLTMAYDTSSGSSANGYKITGANGGSSFANSVVGILSDVDGLYIPDVEKTYANNYWLSSPSANNQFYMISLSFGGALGSMGYYSDKNTGFRPIVCLKPDVELKKINDLEYQIIE